MPDRPPYSETEIVLAKFAAASHAHARELHALLLAEREYRKTLLRSMGAWATAIEQGRKNLVKSEMRAAIAQAPSDFLAPLDDLPDLVARRLK